MGRRQRLGIYEFSEEFKNWPNWKEKGCLALLDSQYHYFAVLDITEEYCTGYMFSTKLLEGNVIMRAGDFKPEGFPFQTPTYFLSVPLKKFHYLKTKSEPVGWLTTDGEQHIQKNARGPVKDWEQYVYEYCQGR